MGYEMENDDVVVVDLPNKRIIGKCKAKDFKQNFEKVRELLKCGQQ